MSARFIPLLAALTAAGGVGCTGELARSSSIAIDDVPTRELREVFRLGGIDAPEHLSFRTEPALAVHRSGLIFAIHARDARVAVLDSGGAFVRWIGGRGNGPGEFQSAFSMGFVGDTLWVRNTPTPRYSLFLLDGTHLSTTPSPPYDFGFDLTWPAGVSGYLDGGKAWVEAEGFVMGEDDVVQLPLLVGDRSLRSLDTLFTMPNPRGSLNGVRFEPFPVAPWHSVATDGSTIAFAEWSDSLPEELVVQLFSAATNERRRLTVLVRARPVPQPVRDSIIDAAVGAVRAVGERMRAQGLPEIMYPAPISRSDAEQAAYLPGNYPPIRRILVGIDETIWIERMNGLERGAWVALDREGSPLFAINLPSSTTLRQASRHAVWATALDSLDVSYLVRWNLVPQ